MRLSEQTDEQLIKQIEDDALAREVFNRLVLSRMRVTDEVQVLEHQRDKALQDYDKAMGQVGVLEHQRDEALLQVRRYEYAVAEFNAKLRSYESGRTCPNCQGWGCRLCCSSDDEIRSRQGIFG